MTRLSKLENGIFPKKSTEFRIFEVDKGTKWFEMKFSDTDRDAARINAERYVAARPARTFVIEECP